MTGSDAGAYRVLHAQGGLDEQALLHKRADALLHRAAREVQHRHELVL